MHVQIKSILNFPSMYSQLKNQQMSIKTAYKLSKLTQEIENELVFYYEKIQEIINKYAVLDESGKAVTTENGNGVKLRPETQEVCYNEVQELQEMEITLPEISFTLDELEKLELTPAQVAEIMPFIIE